MQVSRSTEHQYWLIIYAVAKKNQSNTTIEMWKDLDKLQAKTIAVGFEQIFLCERFSLLAYVASSLIFHVYC